MSSNDTPMILSTLHTNNVAVYTQILIKETIRKSSINSLYNQYTVYHHSKSAYESLMFLFRQHTIFVNTTMLGLQEHQFLSPVLVHFVTYLQQWSDPEKSQGHKLGARKMLGFKI